MPKTKFMKHPTSIRLPEETGRQIEALSTLLGENKSQVITRAIDRMYREEIKMNTEYKASQMLNHFDWDAIVNLMDNEIREQVHAELAPTTDQEFLERYIELHELKYGEPFEIN